MRSHRFLLALVFLVVLVAAPFLIYMLADPERRDLDDRARASAPGKFARLSDGFTHYEVGGPPAGRPVVLVSGFSVPYYIWDPTFAALTKAGFRTLRYDFYGRGFSDRPDVPYNQALYVRQLDELLKSVGIDAPVQLVGVSMGASIITSFADRYADRVRSLVFIDPSFRSPYAPPVTFGWNFLTAVFSERNWADEQLADFLHPENFPDWPDRYRVQMQYRGFRRARLSELVVNAGVDQDEEAIRVGMHPRPVLAFWGMDDRTVPFEQSATFLQQIPSARLIPVENAAHLPHLEQPTVVNSAMIGFLNQ